MELILLFLILLSFNCTPKTVVDDHNNVLYLSLMDEALLEIKQQAQETLPFFLEKMQNPETNESDFQVKYPFEINNEDKQFGYEELWLSNITIKNGLYYGVVSNNPRYVSNIKIGDEVVFDPINISDWLYIKNNEIVGGNSIKYLLSQ